MLVRITDIHAGWPIGTVLTLTDKDAEALLQLKFAVPHDPTQTIRAEDRKETKDTPMGALRK